MPVINSIFNLRIVVASICAAVTSPLSAVENATATKPGTEEHLPLPVSAAKPTAKDAAPKAAASATVAKPDAPPAAAEAKPQITPTVNLFDDSTGGISPSLFTVTDPATGAELPAMDKLPLPTPEPAPPALENPSQNVTVNLINRLVQRGVLTHADAEDLLKIAALDAARARAEEEANDALAPAGDGAVRVAYIPESVKAQIRDELKAEVLAQAKNEKWAGAASFPDWVNHIRWFGDIRVRFEADLFPEGNDNTGSFPNFNAINTGAPFDVSGTVFSPQLNVDEERMRMRLRARFGMDVDLGQGWSAGIRLATGDNNSAVSANQSFGLANQSSGGNFSKYAIWLDRAFIKGEIGGQPNKNLSFTFGRFDNPFFMASDIVWDDDIGFDGAVLQSRYEVFRGVTPFIAGGIFPIFNTDFNFSSNQPDKFESEDKWMYGAQAGVEFDIKKLVAAKFAAAWFDFTNIKGRLSDPYTPMTASDAGNTDNTRPSFAQKGNTYMALRDIIPSALNDYGTKNQWQYFGLASPYTVGAVSGRIDINVFEPYQISLLGDYVKNLQFEADKIDAIAVNNRGPVAEGDLDGIGTYEGGGTAWSMEAQVGKAKFEKRWDWSVAVGYRYVESDAVVDAFADSDFGLGGTNHEGLTIAASLALSKRVKIGVRWMSANEIAGPPLATDVFMFDLTAKF